MTAIPRLIALCFLVLVSACSESMPDGINFVSEAESVVIINFNQGGWRVFVDGAHKPEIALEHLASIPGLPVEKFDFVVREGQVPGVPSEFSLHLSQRPSVLGVTFDCKRCDASREFWKTRDAYQHIR